jgi:hypothetical protein
MTCPPSGNMTMRVGTRKQYQKLKHLKVKPGGSTSFAVQKTLRTLPLTRRNQNEPRNSK